MPPPPLFRKKKLCFHSCPGRVDPSLKTWERIVTVWKIWKTTQLRKLSESLGSQLPLILKFYVYFFSMLMKKSLVNFSYWLLHNIFFPYIPTSFRMSHFIIKLLIKQATGEKKRCYIFKWNVNAALFKVSPPPLLLTFKFFQHCIVSSKIMVFIFFYFS